MGSRGRGKSVRATGVALFTACLAAGGSPAAARAGETLDVQESTAGQVAGCPLTLGTLPVNTWISRSPERLVIRLVPRSREFARCLSIEALELLSSGGNLVAGRRRDSHLLGPLTFDGGSGAVPSKLDTEATGFGIGIGLSFSFGTAEESGSVEFEFRVGDGFGEERAGAGSTLLGTARDECAETTIAIRIPLDRYAPCSGL